MRPLEFKLSKIRGSHVIDCLDYKLMLTMKNLVSINLAGPPTTRLPRMATTFWRHWRLATMMVLMMALMVLMVTLMGFMMASTSPTYLCELLLIQFLYVILLNRNLLTHRKHNSHLFSNKILHRAIYIAMAMLISHNRDRPQQGS